MLRFVSVRTDAQIETVARLAHEIWYEHYVPIIGRAQVDYMVPKFQSAAAMRAQIREGYEYYMACPAPAADGRPGSEPVGYFAIQVRPEENAMFISKLYVRRGDRGRGTGRACLAFIEELARRDGLDGLWLTVNKGNPAVQAYEKAGFRIARAVVTDIGAGFVMDDYRMEKAVT